LCEKPLAISVDECDQIIAAAQAAGVVVVEAVMYLHHPMLYKARELVQDGAVGQVKLVRGAFSVTQDKPTDVRWQPELGGGALWDIGSYPVSFIRWMVSEPDQVFGWQILSDSGVDETFAGLLRYEKGVLGVFNCGFREPYRVQAEVAGTSGRLILKGLFAVGPESRILLRRGSEEEIISVPEADPYRCQVDALTAAVLDGAALPVPLTSSRLNVATLVGLYESARKGVPTTMA
jgi:predicted dehydrogenase